MTYAQLDFTSNVIRRVNLIGGSEVGITQSLIDEHPDQFINLEGRYNVPLDDIDWYYNTETDTFIQTVDLFASESIEESAKPEPTEQELINAEILLTQAKILAKLNQLGV